MGLLAPAFLIAAGALAVPLLLHLFHRHDHRRFSFPALRYLQRTEKEHARRIRVRQLLLLFLRLAAILLVVLAAARPFVRGAGGRHEPTAVAILLDNSMSSGVVVGEERMLDVLRTLALETVAHATVDDRIWVIRVGEPWQPAPPGGPEEAAERIRATEVSAAAGDLGPALLRARELLAASGFQAREIHLLSDLQATGFPPVPGEILDEVPVVVYRRPEEPPANRFLEGLTVGGGLAPLAGQRTEISVAVGSTDPDDPGEVPLRLVVGERIRGATSAAPGRGVTLPLGPFPEGLVTGYVETDPDALSADDRWHFAFRVRPPPVVAVAGPEPFFLSQALAVLESAGRLTRGAASAADVLFSVAGEGLESERTGRAAVILPPDDPTLLPAMNRRLSQAGVPWRVEPGGAPGEAGVAESTLPVDLAAVRVHRHHPLAPAAGEAGATQAAVRLSTGAVWIASGSSAGGPYLLIGSPLDPSATNLPVSAAMVPLLEWLTFLGSASGSPTRQIAAGEEIRLPAAATHVAPPSGESVAVEGGGRFRETRDAGIYQVLGEGALLEQVAVVPPARESRLERLSRVELTERLGGRPREAEDPEAWARAIFVNRQGPELWRPLLAAALLLLLAEAWLAAPGGAQRSRGGPPLDPVESRSTSVQGT